MGLCSGELSRCVIRRLLASRKLEYSPERWNPPAAAYAICDARLVDSELRPMDTASGSSMN